MEIKFEMPTGVFDEIRKMLAPDINGLLCLGGGFLGSEQSIFDFSKIKNIVNLELSDERLGATKNTAVAIRADMAEIARLFPAKSFDVVSLIDSLEHNTKENGMKILLEAERIARKQVIMFVPIQKELTVMERLAKVMDRPVNNHLGDHLSAWTPKELEDLGYEVISDPDYHNRRTGGEMPWGAMVASKKIRPFRILWIQPWFTRVGGMRHMTELVNVWIEWGCEVSLFVEQGKNESTWKFNGNIVSAEQVKSEQFDVAICNWPEVHKWLDECKSRIKVWYFMGYDPEYRTVGVPMEEIFNKDWYYLVNSKYIKERVMAMVAREPFISPPCVNPNHFHPVDCKKKYAVLFHDHPYKRSDKVQQVLKKAGIAPLFGIVGSDETELSLLYSSAITTVVASKSEGFGLIGLESMACGTPPVIMDNGGCNAYLKDGENGLFVKRDDWDGLVEATKKMQKLYGTKEYTRMSKKAIETAKKFNWEIEAGKLLTYFKESLK